jgi:hypothetical protein
MSRYLDILSNPPYLICHDTGPWESRMALKQWNAVIELSAQALITVWLLLNAGNAHTIAEVATMLLWAGGTMIVLTIAGAIIVSILIGIARRDGRREDIADERDRLIFAKSMRNAYFGISVACLATLIVLAMGIDPIVAVYTLFGGGMLAGAVGSVSQLVYYRIG